MHEKSLFERIFISRFSSVNKFSIICNEIFKFTTSHGIINFSAYLYLFLSEVLTALYTYLFVSYYESLYRKKSLVLSDDGIASKDRGNKIAYKMIATIRSRRKKIACNKIAYNKIA